LDIFGDKLSSARLAASLKIPTLSLGSVDNPNQLTQLQQTDGFPVLLKSTRGGGGLGHRLVNSASEFEAGYNRCLSEATKAFAVSGGDSSNDHGAKLSILCEKYLPHARHIEIQIVGDGERVFALGTRECSAQRRFQKVIEVAPAPNISRELETEIVRAAVKLAEAGKYKGVGTMEFLVPLSNVEDKLLRAKSDEFYFMECNPRLQVEHTVTEEMLGLDIVSMQLQIAQGKRYVPVLFMDD
jgi:biotin carboxylase